MGEASDVHRLVVKVGTSVLTDASGRLVPSRLEALTAQIASCSRQGRQPVLVSSGAIACGMAKLNLTRRPKGIAQLQACAAIGQSELMHLYTVAFGAHGMTTAQVLLTQDDLANKHRFANAKQTLLTLLHRRVVPVVNENDTVAVEEITFGDNDRLAALVAVAVDAQLLVLLSDVDGLLQDGKLIERIETLNPAVGPRPSAVGRMVEQEHSGGRDVAPIGAGVQAPRAVPVGLHHGHRAAIRASTRETTKGGMASKLEAARIVGHHGIPMIIANGTRASVLSDLLAGHPVGTLFVPPRNRLSPRKWWIAFSLREPRGELIVDDGAAQALQAGGKSLLPTGVVAVNGRFEAGAFVAIKDGAREEVARGVCNYSSAELSRVRGMKSAAAARALGLRKAKEVVHRDHLVLAKELRA